MLFLASLHYEQTQKMPDTLVAFLEKSLDVVLTMILIATNNPPEY